MEKNNYRRDIPYNQREIIEAPSKYDGQKHLSFRQSLETLDQHQKRGDISPGSATFVKGLLTHGGIAQFPGGLGIMYDQVYKDTFNTKYASRAIHELAIKIRPHANVIFAPEHSAIIPAAIIGELLTLPVIKVKKNGNLPDTLAVQVDSYTGGKVDVLSIAPNQILQLFEQRQKKSSKEKNNYKIKVAVIDEILDTGAMTISLSSLIDEIRKKLDIPIHLSTIAALMEKTYTNAIDKIQKKILIPIFSVAQIEDIGLQKKPWIKICGIEKTLSFFRQ